MKLFHYTNLKEFNTFEEIYKPNVYSVCDLLNPTSTFPPQNFPVIQHLQFLHIYCGYYKFSNSTELG